MKPEQSGENFIVKLPTQPLGYVEVTVSLPKGGVIKNTVIHACGKGKQKSFAVMANFCFS